MRTLLNISFLFGLLSILSIGGGNSVLPEMHREAVTHYQWLTEKQFSDVFAISQAAPGPSILIVTLIGYRAAGIPGGILATVAMILPAGALVYLLTLFWKRAEQSPVRHAIEKGFAPLTVGLVLASAYVIGRTVDNDWKAVLLTAVCTVIFIFTKISPLIVVGAAALLGFLGLV
jgi:chromate transporter